MINDIILQLHGGGKGGSSSTSTTNNTTVEAYKPTEEEKRLWQLQGDYIEELNPYAIELTKKSASILEGSLGDRQYDFETLNAGAQNQISNAQQGVQNLQNGVLPQNYLDNMSAAIQSGLTNTIGSAVNSLGSRGILNSSVTNSTMNDINKNVANTMAEQYNNNISTLNGLYGQQASLATNGISSAAAAQEAAQTPALNLLNASLGAGSTTTGAISALRGSGTTTGTTSGTTTTNTSNNGGFWNGFASTALTTFCFDEFTPIVLDENGNTKYIRDVIVGDTILTYDVENNKYTTAKVTYISSPNKVDSYCVATKEGNVVFTTDAQPLLKENGEWSLVNELTINTPLKGAGIVKGITYAGQKNVCDLKVENTNVYIANGFVALGAND